MGWKFVATAIVCLVASSLSASTIVDCKKAIAFPDGDAIEMSTHNALDFIRYQDYTASMGATASFVDPKLRARVYFGLSEPDRNGNIPLVAEDARAVLIYFHGSGTKKASGKNFIHKMQLLANAGVAPISVDLPFHSEGVNDSQLYRLDYFMEWLRQLVLRCQASGKPIYMAGHSFGPMIVLEYMARYPSDIAGALLVSAAAANHPALNWTYQNIVERGMHLIDENAADSVANAAGGHWAFEMQRQSRWAKLPPPRGKIHFLRGTEDEWFPENRRLPKLLGVRQPYGPRVVEDYYRSHFPQAKFSFVEGVGHYIFETRNANGKNLILDRLFELMEVPENERYPTSSPLSPREMVASLYYSNPLFRHWVGGTYRHRLATPERALTTLKDWKAVNVRLWNEIFFKIPETSPDFYQQRMVSWEKLGHQIQKSLDGNYICEWDGDMKIFQAEYLRYLEAGAKGQKVTLGNDPHHPPLAKFDDKFRQGFVSRWAVVGSLLLPEIVSQIEKYGTLQKIETLPAKMIRVTYQLNGKEVQACVFSELSREEAELVWQEAFQSARRQNYWQLPADRWEGEARGYRIRGTHHQGVITSGELVCPD